MSAGPPSSLQSLREWRSLAAVHRDIGDLVRKPPTPFAGIAQLALQWLIIVAAISAAQHAETWPASLLAIIVIGTRQHALLVLMHDASHFLLSRHRPLNDLLSNLFLSYPLLISTEGYRAHHLAHHQHLNTPEDPDIADALPPASAAQLWRSLLKDLSGLSTLTSLRSINQFGVLAIWRRRPRAALGERLLFPAFLVVVVAATAAWQVQWLVLTYWVAPVVFVLPALLRIRGLSEHGGLVAEAQHRAARSVATHGIERFVFAPCNINRHFEHHLFPKVPSYRLEQLSRRLRGLPDGPVYQEAHGYLLGGRCVLAELFPEPANPP